MGRGSTVAWVGIALTIFLLPFVQLGYASQSGYVAYSVLTTSGRTQETYSINESVSPSPTKGESILSIYLRSATTNLTDARFVNSSIEVFPYVPAVSNLTYTYSNDSYVVTAHVAEVGSSRAAFQGIAFTLEDYSFYANVSKAQTAPQTLSGNFTTLPSGLIYSLSIVSNDTSAVVTLVSTSLPLEASSGGITTSAASAGLGVSAVVGAVALSLGVRSKRSKNGQQSGQRPDYWVD